MAVCSAGDRVRYGQRFPASTAYDAANRVEVGLGSPMVLHTAGRAGLAPQCDARDREVNRSLLSKEAQE